MSPMRWKGLVAILALAVAVTVPGGRGGAAPATQAVGVVDFYAPTPLGAFGGLVPERFAADDLSNMLAHAAAGRFVVIARDLMGRAEMALRWQDADVLHFDRLRALARAVGADALVVGWISALTLSTGGGSVTFPPDGDGPPTADATVVVQVFDAAQGRLVTGSKYLSSSGGLARELLARQVLHLALEPAVPPIVDALRSP